MTPREKFLVNYDAMAEWFIFPLAMTDDELAAAVDPYIPIEIDRRESSGVVILYLEKYGADAKAITHRLNERANNV